MKVKTFIQFVLVSRTTAFDIHHVPGLPKSAQIYHIEASRFWQFRFFVERKYLRKSTEETDKAAALAKAEGLLQRHASEAETRCCRAHHLRFWLSPNVFRNGS